MTYEREHPDDEALAALAAGALQGGEAGAIRAHVAACAACTDMVEWLRAEGRLLAERAEAIPGPSLAVWERIAERTGLTEGEAPRPVTRPARPAGAGTRRALWVGLAGGALAAAAAAVLVLGGPRTTTPPAGPAPVAVNAADASVVAPAPLPTPSPGEAPRAVAALDAADRQLDEAIATLERDYQRRRAQLPPARARKYDEQFSAAVRAVEAARQEAGNDVQARRHLVRARSQYLRTIQTVVLREGRS